VAFHIVVYNRDDRGNGIGNPMGNPTRMGIDDTMGREWEGMGITLYGNGNGPYSHGNKFPSADAVMSDDF